MFRFLNSIKTVNRDMYNRGNPNHKDEMDQNTADYPTEVDSPKSDSRDLRNRRP